MEYDVYVSECRRFGKEPAQTREEYEAKNKKPVRLTVPKTRGKEPTFKNHSKIERP